MQTAQRNLAATTVNGKIYAIGGTGSANTMEVYDPTVATQVWALVTSMPTGRQNLAAATVNGKIYAIGGFDVNFNPVNTVEAYDPSSNSWSTAASMITAREGLAATDASGLIYAVGGAGSPQILNATEQYSPPVTIYTFIKN
jgi:N-acetylneuraminic acid mutarotase